MIDDASPDGTGELADRLARELPWLEVLHRERKEGLGPAYLDGFRRGRSRRGRRPRSLEMDCDFSHDPADVPRLVEAAGEADLVIGSRYVPGERVGNWGAAAPGGQPGRLRSTPRRASGSAVTRLRPRASSVFRRAVLETIDLDRIETKGYAFQIETTYRALRAGFRVAEVPIAFVDRDAGSSKMSRGDRRRGRLEGARASARSRAWASLTVGIVARRGDRSPRSPTTPSSRRCSQPTGRSSSTSGLPGAGPAAMIAPILDEMAGRARRRASSS